MVYGHSYVRIEMLDSSALLISTGRGDLCFVSGTVSIVAAYSGRSRSDRLTEVVVTMFPWIR